MREFQRRKKRDPVNGDQWLLRPQKRISVQTGGANGRGQLCEQSMGFAPIDAGIGDALSIDQRLAWHEFLRSHDQIAFDHDAEDAAVPRGHLWRHIAAPPTLTTVVLIARALSAVRPDTRP